jgi:hypothetical protein
MSVDVYESAEVHKVTKEESEAIKKLLEKKGENEKPEENSEVLNEDKMRAFAKALLKAEADETEEIIRQDIAKKEAERGGKGSVGLRPEDLEKERQGHSEGKTFSNHAELVSYLKEQIRKGDAQAKEQYKQLVAKSVRALKEKQIVWTDNNPEEPSFIQHV